MNANKRRPPTGRMRSAASLKTNATLRITADYDLSYSTVVAEYMPRVWLAYCMPHCSKWECSDGRFGSVSSRNPGCDRVALPNLNTKHTHSSIIVT